MSRRVALVTGSSRGIGLATAVALARAGFAVAVNGPADDDELAQARAQVADCGGDVFAAAFDVTDTRAHASALADIEAALGPLTTLVNNAGVGLATGVSPEEVINTNLYGVKRVTEAFVATGLVSDRVVNVGSGSGPGYVRRCPRENQRALCVAPASWDEIEGLLALSEDGRT
ncbi:MAG: SDR family NAD(P)-dependent oxidoreductase, partial [Pseudomonadota bacterium]